MVAHVIATRTRRDAITTPVIPGLSAAEVAAILERLVDREEIDERDAARLYLGELAELEAIAAELRGPRL